MRRLPRHRAVLQRLDFDAVLADFRDVDRLLLVDDNPTNLQVLYRALEQEGYELLIAQSGQDAIAIAGEAQPHLILLDVNMPGMDGVELYQRILKVHPNLKAIMITAYAGDDGMRRAEQAGTWKIVHKPVDIKMLLTIIDEAID